MSPILSWGSDWLVPRLSLSSSSRPGVCLDNTRQGWRTRGAKGHEWAELSVIPYGALHVWSFLWMLTWQYPK